MSTTPRKPAEVAQAAIAQAQDRTNEDWRARVKARHAKQDATRERAARAIAKELNKPADDKARATLDRVLLHIAQEHTGFETLATRNSDGLDFQEVSVWGMKAALEAAFMAGIETGIRVATPEPGRSR